VSLTNFAALTNEQKTVWSRDFWAAARNASFINKFAGTGPNSMVQRIPELTKDEKGARAVITLVADLVGEGVAGDNTLEGNEEAMKSFDQVIRIDQLRHANQHLGRMADQKSVVNFREQSRDKLAYWIGDRMDQIAFLTLTGVSYAFKNTGPGPRWLAAASAGVRGRRHCPDGQPLRAVGCGKLVSGRWRHDCGRGHGHPELQGDHRPQGLREDALRAWHPGPGRRRGVPSVPDAARDGEAATGRRLHPEPA
jgi:hypothetical protein